MEEGGGRTHVLVADVLQQLQLPVGPLAQHRCRERLHDLLDGDGGVGELIFGRTGGEREGVKERNSSARARGQAKRRERGTNQTRPKAPIPVSGKKKHQRRFEWRERGRNEEEGRTDGVANRERRRRGGRRGKTPKEVPSARVATFDLSSEETHRSTYLEVTSKT